MSATTEKAAPRKLKTWSHLMKNRRKPSEYEIVSTNLHFSMNDPEAPFELSPALPINQWFIKYRNKSPLAHDDWDSFRDPDEQIYRTYNMVQDGAENYVDGLLEEFAGLEHDAGLSPNWLDVLEQLYTPQRYMNHTLQMASAYITQMATASTISNCTTFQAADCLRWLSHIAYRTKELQNAWPKRTFGKGERNLWENDEAWQGFRELMERLLVSYDWGEAFAATCLVAKPAFDEACLRQFAATARRNGDTLLALLADAQLRDMERHRRWTSALVRFLLTQENNFQVLEEWVHKWVPLGDAAINAFCAALPDSPTAADDAKRDVWAFRAGLGFTA